MDTHARVPEGPVGHEPAFGPEGNAFSNSDYHPLGIGIAVTLLTLFTVGSLRALVTNLHGLPAGMEMLIIGPFPAAVSYGVGFWIASLV
jgi:VIT1/CCC1 family predicted Fe2+/Mn2+ transporter